MIKRIYKNVKEYFTPIGPDVNDNHLKNLNYIIYALVAFLVIYAFVFMSDLEGKADKIINKQDSLRTVAMYPTTRQVGGINLKDTNNRSLALVSTNILKDPIQIVVDDKKFTINSIYERGDIVLIKFFNIFAIIEDKSFFTKDYYTVLYRDNEHRLNSIDVPVDFLLKPAADAITPFIFTP